MHNEILFNSGVYYLTGEISQESVQGAIEFILSHGFMGKVSELSLVINSQGGDVCAAFALIDVMVGSPIPIHTVGLGEVASAALLIFMAGKYRVLTPNTMVLSHQFTAGVYGKNHELLAARKMLDHTQVNILRHYKKFTGLEEDKILAELLPSQDIWLDAEEALSYQLCDEIVDRLLVEEQE